MTTTATCTNPRCKDGWVEWGNNESGGAPIACKVCRERLPVGTFGAAPDVVASWQGGFITLHYYGCRNCGNAFWTEGDRKRRLKPGALAPCPHCKVESIVPEVQP